MCPPARCRTHATLWFVCCVCVGGFPPGAPSWRPSRRLGGALSRPCSCTTSTRFNSLQVVRVRLWRCLALVSDRAAGYTRALWSPATVVVRSVRRAFLCTELWRLVDTSTYERRFGATLLNLPNSCTVWEYWHMSSFNTPPAERLGGAPAATSAAKRDVAVCGRRIGAPPRETAAQHAWLGRWRCRPARCRRRPPRRPC